jgi:hypothetical protein
LDEIVRDRRAFKDLNLGMEDEIVRDRRAFIDLNLGM